METVEQIRDRIFAAVPGAEVTVVTNPAPNAQHSLLVDRAHARAAAVFLRDDAELRLDFCSNVTGVDFPAKEIVESVKTKVAQPDGTEKLVETKVKKTTPAYLEVVYHLYSMAKKHGPVILRVRTGDRDADVTVPSLTPVWRAAEFQEREAYDLYGIRFEGHPDLRRILMWDEFKDHPMRKDYVAPDDFEWEPTPHDDVLARAKAHYPAAPVPAAAPTAAAPVAKKEASA